MIVHFSLMGIAFGKENMIKLLIENHHDLRNKKKPSIHKKSDYQSKENLLIKEIPLESYVEGVVAAEVGGNWHPEALKVQAVISRTYALYYKDMYKNRPYHLTSSMLHQVYNHKEINFSIKQAVQETKGEVLTYQGKTIKAIYHSTCGGRTELPEEIWQTKYPYLKSRTYHDTISPYYTWQRKITMKELGNALNLKDIIKMQILSYTATGKVKTLKVSTKKRAYTVKAKELREQIGFKKIPSTSFTLKVKNRKIFLKGKGFGHGVGLCQYGALQMALEGKDYKEILYYFYPNTLLWKKI